MKVILFTIIGLIPFCGHAQNQLGAMDLDSYIVTYEVQRKGRKRGLAERSLHIAGDNTYSLTMHSEASMLFYSIKTCENSTFNINSGHLIPLKYHKVDDRTFKKTQRSSLDFSSDYKRVNGSNGKNQWELAANNQMLDPLLAYEAMRLDAKKSPAESFTYLIPEEQGNIEYNLIYAGEESISTPIGQADTIKYTRIRPNSSRKTTFWLDVKNQFIPIKVMQTKDGKEQATLIISKPIAKFQDTKQGNHKWKVNC